MLGQIFVGVLGFGLFWCLIAATTSKSTNKETPQAMTVCEKATMEWRKAADARDTNDVSELKSPWGIEKWKKLRDASVEARLESEKASNSQLQDKSLNHRISSALYLPDVEASAP